MEPAHSGVPATQGGEREQAAYRDRQPNQRADVSNKCTQICGSNESNSKSCSKLVLVNVVHSNYPDRILFNVMPCWMIKVIGH